MRQGRYAPVQIALASRQVEPGTTVKEVIPKMGICEQTFHRWKKRSGGLDSSEVRRLQVLEEKNRRLKQLVANPSLDKHMLQEVLA
ncbi:MAG: transposase, partial [Candidatus Neomarinimicrobiota bacterium]